jgi:hypothetical protein
MRRAPVVLAALLVPALAHAFAMARISEVWVNATGTTGAEYVEIEMLADGQTDVSGTRLSVFNCTGSSVVSVFPTGIGSNVPHGGTGVRWSMGTAEFQTATGVTPDFIYPSATLKFYASCGMVCWGKPTAVSNPDQYVDCLAYGAYSGTLPATVGAPNAANPNHPTESLTRIMASSPANDALDFALATPSPTNSTLSSATTTTTPGATTSTTTAGEGTTTTTIPSGVGATVAGTQVVLKTPKNAAKASFVVVLKDRSIGLGDPTVGGGALRIFTSAFDRTYPLDGSRWKAIRKGGVVKGYKYANPAGPIRLVLVKDGKMLKANGHGAGLGLSLATDPAPVNVLLAAGGQRDCATFANGKFVAGKRWVGRSAPRPAACP